MGWRTCSELTVATTRRVWWNSRLCASNGRPRWAKHRPEHGKAAGQGGAPHIDDPRLRQDHLDQADQREVGAHLVEEEGPAEPAMRLGRGKIARPQLRCVVRTEPFQHLP